MSKIPLSVFIITKNEEDRIATSVGSVIDFADEVLVVDSGSTDKTVEIAKKLGAKASFNKWSGYGRQKIHAEKLCKNDWILNLDADEEISGALAREIAELLGSNKIPDDAAGFMIKMVELPHFAKNASSLSQYKKYLRLYNKKKASFRDSTVHDSVVVKEGKAYDLEKKMLHRSTRSYEHAVEKINLYSNMQAQDAIKKGKKVCAFQLFFVHILSFLKHFFFRRSFLYGVDGYLDSHVYAFSRFLKYAKIREKQRRNK